MPVTVQTYNSINHAPALELFGKVRSYTNIYYTAHYGPHSGSLLGSSYTPEMTDSFQPSRSMGRPEVLEKHWSSRMFSLFSSASFLGQSDPPPPAQPLPREDACWFSELQERERRPSEHHSLGGEPCSHPSCTLRVEERGGVELLVRKLLIADQSSHALIKTLTHLSCLFLEAKALCSSSIMQLGGMGGCIILPRCGDPEELSRGPRSGSVIEDKHSVALCGGSLGR